LHKSLRGKIAGQHFSPKSKAEEALTYDSWVTDRFCDLFSSWSALSFYRRCYSV